MIKPLLRPSRFVPLPIFALPITLFGQAAVEYALKSAQSAVNAGGNSVIAGCRVDSTLLTCLRHSYPRTTLLTVIVICLLILRWLASYTGYRTR
jgi:hypothetical protein